MHGGIKAREAFTKGFGHHPCCRQLQFDLLLRKPVARLPQPPAMSRVAPYDMQELKMTRHQLAAALYAPLRVVLFEDEHGRGVFEYDKPSSCFGQYGDARVTEVGRYLDAALEEVLRNAAG